MALLFFSMYSSVAYSQGTYKLVITVRDKDSIPVGEASVRVTTKWGPEDYRDVTPILSTNSSGTVVYPNAYSVEGSAHISIAKSGIELAKRDYALVSPVTYITIICQGLASLVVHARDSSNQSLENAQVNLDWQGLDSVPWALSQTTDSEGNTIFPQMSFLTYQVQVLWQGLLVHQGTFNFSDTSRNCTAQCNVHDLTVRVFDAANNSLSNSKVTVTRSDEWKLPPKYTAEGFVVFPQLAGSNYTVNVFYGTYSNTTTITLSNSQTLSIEINFLPILTYNIAIKVIWSDAKPVATASVIVQNNEEVTFFSGIANATGIAVIQLTEGTYTITASKGNATKTQPVNVNDETTITVVLEAAYRISKLIVEVYDQDQLAYGSVVELYSKGYLVYNFTAVDGTVTFNLPDGTYAVVARYQGQEQEAGVALNQDTRLPIVFQTIDEFNSLIVIVVVFALSAILIATRKSRAQQKRSIRRHLSNPTTGETLTYSGRWHA
jgi:hypothetical protein